ncbi:MAG: ribonuclease inhibitor [Adhaeribacter sp.]|nr:ribonuclease inhibitor [Adhaeribacter sp.]
MKDKGMDEVIARVRREGGPERESNRPAEIPAVKVASADSVHVEQLQRRGIIIMPVAKGSPFLTANLVNAQNFSDADMNLLSNLRLQLVWLDMSSSKITDKGLPALAGFKNLTCLSLDNTAVTDAGLKHLEKLTNLHYLNPYGTNVTDKGLKSLAACKSLKNLYLWQTQVTSAGVAALQRAWGANVKINFDNVSDTIGS